MRVKVKAKGFYGGALRYVGTIFEVPDGTQASWFEPVDKKPDEPKAKKQRWTEKLDGPSETPESISDLA
jgi:hypothetical protein